MPIHNAPILATTFVGRQVELNELIKLLGDPSCRLLTLSGLGGIGKTRLALAVAQRVEDEFADGVYIVSLQSLQSSDQIVPAIIATLDIQVDQNTRDRLLNWLYEKHLLLVLDNFEHLLDGVDLLTDMLATAPHVKLLVTSRDALRVQSEWVRQLRGLDFPDEKSFQPNIVHSAIQLFIDRARQQRGDLDIETHYSHIMRICQLVEGMPLALELAAGWVKSLSCAAIADELTGSLDLLTARNRDVSRRHLSMKVVFEHSWHSLSDENRAVWQGFAVFRGGCTREAAEQITGTTLPILTSLVEKSLLRYDVDTRRYDLHELLRQYISRQLNQPDEFKEACLDRHCDYYTGLLHQQERNIQFGNLSDALSEIDNLRAAWTHAVHRRKLTALQRAAPGLCWLFQFQGSLGEGMAMFYQAEEALRQLVMTDDARFLLGMMQMFRVFHQYLQSERADSLLMDIRGALTLWEGLEERREMGLPLTRAMLSSMYIREEPEKVIALARKSLTFARHHADLASMAISLTALANISFLALGDFVAAQEHIDEALAIDRQIGFDLNAGWSNSVLGAIAFLQGRYDDARAHFEKSFAHHNAANNFNALTRLSLNLGIAALESGDDVTARTNFMETIRLANKYHQHIFIAQGRAGLGILAAFQGDMDAAAIYFEDSHAALYNGRLLEIYEDARGQLALLLGLYEHTLVMYESIRSHYMNTDYRIPLMCYHSRAGHALIALDDEPRALPYLFDALQETTATGAFQVLMEIVLSISQLSLVPPSLSVELLVAVSKCPASNRFSRMQAKRMLVTREATLPQNDFNAALERGGALTPAEVAVLVKPFSAGLDQPKLKQSLIVPLSQRELEVLELIAEGLINREIAGRLFIGVSTVKKHIQHIYAKLDTKNRTSAVARARELNFIQ